MKANLTSNNGESKIFIGPGGQVLQPIDSEGSNIKGDEALKEMLQQMLRLTYQLMPKEMVIEKCVEARTNEVSLEKQLQLALRFIVKNGYDDMFSEYVNTECVGGNAA